MNRDDKREGMLSMLSDWRSSGKSKKQYCAENRVSPTTFYYWFSRSKALVEVSGGFVEISKIERQSTSIRAMVLIPFPSLCRRNSCFTVLIFIRLLFISLKINSDFKMHNKRPRGVNVCRNVRTTEGSMTSGMRGQYFPE